MIGTFGVMLWVGVFEGRTGQLRLAAPDGCLP
jgi:hypothetical protein